MKSESGLYFTKKLELAKDTHEFEHEFEPREGAPSGGPQHLSTQPCASGERLQPGSPSPGCASQRLAVSPAGSVPFEGSRFPASPLAPQSWVSGWKSLCSPHFQFLLSTSLCSFHGCEHFLTSVPPASLQALPLSPSPVRVISTPYSVQTPETWMGLPGSLLLLSNFYSSSLCRTKLIPLQLGLGPLYPSESSPMPPILPGTPWFTEHLQSCEASSACSPQRSREPHTSFPCSRLHLLSPQPLLPRARPRASIVWSPFPSLLLPCSSTSDSLLVVGLSVSNSLDCPPHDLQVYEARCEMEVLAETLQCD